MNNEQRVNYKDQRIEFLKPCFSITFHYNIQNSHFFHMKKNILFIFSAIVALIFVIAFGITTYRYYQAIHSDDPINPYLQVEQ